MYPPPHPFRDAQPENAFAAASTSSTTGESFRTTAQASLNDQTVCDQCREHDELVIGHLLGSDDANLRGTAIRSPGASSSSRRQPRMVSSG
jgi:hypothetical protein